MESITLEQALKMGLKPFVDDRINCTDCKGYKANAYMGKCHLGKIQYPKLKNRCNMFASKVLQTTENFWEIEQEKPFWEI